VSEQHPMVGRQLTSNDPQPPVGTRVRDACGTVWVNDGYYPVCWVQDPLPDYHDPESWTKIAGNYGPVTTLKWGDERVDKVLREMAGRL
jgi:hypothetical protein